MKYKLLLLLCIIITDHFSQVTKTSKWRKTERDSFENAFLLYEEGNHEMAFPIYEEVNKNHPNQAFIRYMYGITALSRSDKHPDALTYLTEAYNKNKKIILIEYHVAKALHLNYKFDEAEEMLQQFLTNKRTKADEKPQGELLKKYIENAKKYYNNPRNAKITNIGPPVNTPNEEYAPVVAIDESMIVFTYRGEKSKGGRMNAFGETSDQGIYWEDVFVSYKVNDTLQEPKPIDNINTTNNDAAISISHDGNTLFIYRDNADDHGDIYQSKLSGDEFSIPVKLIGEVNSFAWDGHCSLTPDGRTLYFSSERAGGYGGKDLYSAQLMPDSTWGNVKNLGPEINSKYDEDAPYIHPDGISLFFSSNGESSMGGYDIFKSVMDLNDSTFKSFENLGSPINTPDNDIYFVLAGNGKRGYYSSGKAGGEGLKDIYLIEADFGTKMYLVKGKVTYEGNPVEASIKTEIIKTDTTLYTINKANKVSGNYLTPLPAGAKYKITFAYDTFPSQHFIIDAEALSEYTEKIIDVRFDIPKEVRKDSTNAKDTLADTFVTKNPRHTSTKGFAAKYGDVVVEGLEYRVQVAAYKYPKNYTYKHLKGLGDIDKTIVNNKITFITVGGKFKTLREAWDLNKKAISAGQNDAFVIAIYKGKKMYLEELVKLGVFEH